MSSGVIPKLGQQMYFSASGNKLTIAGYSSDTYGLIGGYSSADDTAASNNSVTMNSGKVKNILIGGFNSSATGTASGNTVTVNGGSINTSNYDLYGISGGIGHTANNNTVNVTKNFTGESYYLHGGQGRYGSGSTANHNTVKLQGGSFAEAYGAEAATANYNTLTIDGATITISAIAGQSHGGTADYNTLNIDSGSINGTSFGGHSDSGTASGNVVNLSGGTMRDVYGGQVDDGTASNNIVNFSGGTVNGTLYGGVAATSTGNTLNVLASGLAAQNIENFQKVSFYVPATVTSGSTLLTLNGDAQTSLDGIIFSVGTNGLAAGSAVTLLQNSKGITKLTISTLGTLADTITVGYKGTEGNESADTKKMSEYTSNDGAQIYISDDTTRLIYWLASATNSQTLNIADSTAYTTYVNTYGRYDLWPHGGSASGNTLTVGTKNAANTALQIKNTAGTDGQGNVYGGYDYNSSSNSTGNTLNLYSGTMANAYGGFSVNGTATGNTVNLYGGSISGTIYGGYGTTVTGNTLNVYGSGLTAGNIANFAAINFYLPSTVTSGTTILSLTGGSATNLTGTAISAGISGSASVKVGDTINLLTNSSGLTTDSTTTYGKLTQGVSVDYGLTVTKSDANTITATITSVPSSNNGSTNGGTNGGDNGGTNGGDNGGTNGGDNGGDNTNTNSTTQLKEQTKSLTETRAGMASFLNGLGDTLASVGIGNAVGAAQSPDTGFQAGTTVNTSAGTSSGNASLNTGSSPAGDSHAAGTTGAADGGNSSSQDSAKTQTAAAKAGKAAAPTAGTFAPFAAVGGSNLRAHSGSYVDSHGVNMNVGFSRAIPQRDGILTFGPLVEYGTGSYDSYLDDGTHGSGNTHSFGLGAFIRKDKKGGLWYEGSLRFGRISSDYQSVLNSGTTPVSYDSSSHYYAAHLGIGRIIPVGKSVSLDVYGKYFFTHQTGAGADLSTGEHYEFDAVNSSRLRIGTRYTHSVNERSALYAGLAYEYEFAGDARATYNGMSTPSPSIKGGSGFVELGWRVKPAKKNPLTIDLGLNYWQGKHEGLTVNTGLEWKF